MSLSAAVTPFVTHLLPILFFVYLITDIMFRNPKSVEHRLTSGIILCCLLMFTEEFMRHYLPIEYSPIISAAWFSTAGITITGFGLHLFVKLAHLNRRMPRWLFPYIFYTPTVLVIINLFVNDQMISGNEFHQVGIWKLPVYNAAYYIAMVGSNLFNVLYVLILLKGKKRSGSRELNGIFNELIAGVIVTAFFNLVIGTIDFRGYLPPYPYIYGALAWCILLRRTMLKYDFLTHLDKRYEKLFNMNPAAILLFDLEGGLREANPSARQLFASMGLAPQQFFGELQEETKRQIAAGRKITPSEMTIRRGDQCFEVLMDGDYVLVEHVIHAIIIIRDVTQEKKNQRDIAFLAYHDALTGLPNRRYFLEKLNHMIVHAQQSRMQLAVVIFDLDLFKSINDKHGHAAGDKALVHIASLLEEVVVHGGGAAARFGGDEFALFLRVESKDEVLKKVQQLRRALQEHPLEFADLRIPLQVSIGVSMLPGDGQDSDTLLNHADKALYMVKRSSRNGFCFYSELGEPARE